MKLIFFNAVPSLLSAGIAFSDELDQVRRYETLLKLTNCIEIIVGAGIEKSGAQFFLRCEIKPSFITWLEPSTRSDSVIYL